MRHIYSPPFFTANNSSRCYNTTLRAIIPLPDPEAPLNSAAHPSAYQEFPAGSTVMALYPDTSCFYRAEVIAIPSEGRVSLRDHVFTPPQKLTPWVLEHVFQIL